MGVISSDIGNEGIRKNELKALETCSLDEYTPSVPQILISLHWNCIPLNGGGSEGTFS